MASCFKTSSGQRTLNDTAWQQGWATGPMKTRGFTFPWESKDHSVDGWQRKIIVLVGGLSSPIITQNQWIYEDIYIYIWWIYHWNSLGLPGLGRVCFIQDEAILPKSQTTRIEPWSPAWVNWLTWHEQLMLSVSFHHFGQPRPYPSLLKIQGFNFHRFWIGKYS